MRWLRYALWPAGLAFGVAAEWVGRPDLIALDAAAGFALVFLGLVAWSRRPGSRVGPIMSAAGFAWFLGTLWPPAVFLHRGLLALSARRYVGATGTERRARLASLTAAAAFGLVLMAGAIVRLAGFGSDRAMLAWYDLTVCVIAIGLAADLFWGRWARGAVTGLVVDLGEPAAGGVLRDRLARTLGDPTLVVGYWLPGQRRYVDEAGRPVELPAAGAGRAVTPIEENGRRIAVLVHDLAVLDDPALLSAAGSAAQLAVSNARLQAEVSARVGEVEASRRRIVEASDEQRSRLERDLREGAERRLAHAAELLSDGGGPLAD